jgi:hypothetical protein
MISLWLGDRDDHLLGDWLSLLGLRIHVVAVDLAADLFLRSV